LHILRRYWERIFSRLKKPSEASGRDVAGVDGLEREIAAISGKNHSLAEQVQRVRTDFERAHNEEDRKIAELEQVRAAMQLAREADSRKLHDLETRLAETEASHKQAREQVTLLENTLAETTTRLEQTDRQIRDLQSSSVEQAKAFQTSLADANERLESADIKVKMLGSRLDSEHRHVLKTFEELHGRLRKQDVRLNWTFTAAGFALLLGTAAGAVLIWDVQKNAALLASMSQDIRELMTSVNGQLGMRHTPPQAPPQLALPVTPPGSKVTAKQASGGTAVSPPSSSPSATVSKSESGSSSLSSALNRGRSVNREVKRQYTRQEARTFFMDNAKVDGVVSLASGVQYRVVKPGSGKSPSASDQVVVAYVGIKPDGGVFDETYSTGAPSTFSMKELMPGWREVLLKMQEGAEFELYVPPKLATSGGTRKRSMLGFEPSIYLIELKQVVKAGATAASSPAK